jgi:hypothetical protein
LTLAACVPTSNRALLEEAMSKLNIGVGDDFPLHDAPTGERNHSCGAHWRARHLHHRRHHRHRPLAALLVLPAAAASVTAAILFPLATLGVIGGLGAAAAIYRQTRRNGANLPQEQK